MKAFYTQVTSILQILLDGGVVSKLLMALG